jgi:hypothetical protein
VVPDILFPDETSLVEIDRLLRPGGYFVWVMPFEKGYVDEVTAIMRNRTSRLGWEVISMVEHDMVAVWRKRALDIDLK